MFDHTHYVPILRWKRAEKRALSQLKQEIGRRITPLIEPTPWAFSDPNPQKPKTAEQKLSKIAEDILQNWGQEPFFLDLYHVPLDIGPSNGSHHMTEISQQTRLRQLHLIPVTGIDRDISYQKAVAATCNLDGHGACLRLFCDDLRSSFFVTKLDALISQLGIKPEQIDLVVDYQFCDSEHLPDFTLFTKTPYLDQWRTLTCVSGAFPKNLSDFKVGISLHSRLDWLTWRNQLSQFQGLPRTPSFGDYTIQHPIFQEPPDFASVSASIRYTSEENWVIMRGESVRKDDGPGYAQWPANAQLLCEHTEFKGRNYSKGDEYIECMGQQDKHTGNAETWLQAGFNHHITFVVNQIANLFEISVANES